MEALGRAAVEPDGLLLHGSRQDSLFAASSAAKRAAQLCKSEGYLHVLRTEPRGRGVREICAITQKGLDYLLHQASPKHVLEDLVKTLHFQQAQISELLTTVRQWQTKLDALKTFVEKSLIQSDRNGRHFDSSDGTDFRSLQKFGSLYLRIRNDESPGGEKQISCALRESILSHLSQWDESGDCPLPRLYDSAGRNRFTIGQFHDELRQLHKEEQIYLHPWTGPLSEIPEPALALLAGHGIAYYASRRSPCL
jgi:hypothetical protein